MTLLIRQNGNVAYRRNEGNFGKSIDAPLQGFDGNHFTVGIGPLATTFTVTVTPHPEAGIWTMTVDGVALARR
ncbi:hypothetical protein [Chitinolyticbacter albus]|uniref:hypothetical protein n=1 Tax=Chitinolyticbacter albus TaxID=2961951 RepID=UPI002108FAB6|nr:hypothetical protein [Chitinolyticbacter albus]